MARARLTYLSSAVRARLISLAPEPGAGLWSGRGLEIGLVLAFAAAHFAGWRGWPRSWLERAPDPAYAFGYGLAWALVLPWVQIRMTPFIYFQF